MRRILPVLLLVGAPVSAAEIRWTGSGAVSGTAGSGFAGLANVGDPVEVELVYDSAALVDPRSFFPIGGGVAGSAWFHGPANLAITVTIGDRVWRGEMPNIPEDEDVMQSVCWDFAGSRDVFTLTLDSARGGTYPDFPHGGSGTARSLEVEFCDDASPADLFTVHRLPDTLSCLPEMTSASGAVRAGDDAIAFSIDPASVRVSQPQVPVGIAAVPGGIELRWDTHDGKSYRLEGTRDLKCWVREAEFVGDGNPVIDVSNPFGTDSRRFYRVVEY